MVEHYRLEGERLGTLVGERGKVYVLHFDCGVNLRLRLLALAGLVTVSDKHRGAADPLTVKFDLEHNTRNTVAVAIALQLCLGKITGSPARTKKVHSLPPLTAVRKGPPPWAV